MVDLQITCRNGKMKTEPCLTREQAIAIVNVSAKMDGGPWEVVRFQIRPYVSSYVPSAAPSRLPGRTGTYTGD
jgi:hypothetical protein